MNTLNRIVLKILTFFLLLLFFSAIIPTQAAEGELEEGYEFVWNADTTIILYFPNNGGLANGLSVPNNLAEIEAKMEQNAWRDVRVFLQDEGPRAGLIGVELDLTWSTSSKAISFEDWRAEQIAKGNFYTGNTDINFGLGLSTTDNGTGEVVVDVIPDSSAVEGDVSRSSVDTAGTLTNRYKNTTDVDTTSSVIIDFTDYNHSAGEWLEVSGLAMTGGANITIDISYANSTGDILRNATVFTSDQYLAAEDLIVKLPDPWANSTYVDAINFTSLELDEFRLFDMASDDYDIEASDYVFDNEIASSLDLNALTGFRGWAQSNKAKLKSFSVKSGASKIAQDARGFINLKTSALSAATKATGTKIKNVVDHEVVKARDKITTPGTLSNKMYTSMSKAYDDGQKNAQAAVREARKHLKAVQVTVGVKAEQFGQKVDHAKDLTSQAIAGIAQGGGKAVNSVTNWTKGIFDNAKDTLGRLPEKGASLFAKMSDGIFKLGDNAKKILIIAIIVIFVVLAFVLMIKMM